MLGTAVMPSFNINIGSNFFKTYFLDILFSRAHLLGTLSIFRLKKFLV